MSGHCYQCEPLQGIKELVRMPGSPNLEKCFQDAGGGSLSENLIAIVAEKQDGLAPLPV